MHSGSGCKKGSKVKLRGGCWGFSPDALKWDLTYEESNAIWTSTRTWIPEGIYEAASPVVNIEPYYNPIRVGLKTPGGIMLVPARYCSLLKEGT